MSRSRDLGRFDLSTEDLDALATEQAGDERAILADADPDARRLLEAEETDE